MVHLKSMSLIQVSQESSGTCGYVLGNGNAPEIIVYSWAINLMWEGVERGSKCHLLYSNVSLLLDRRRKVGQVYVSGSLFLRATRNRAACERLYNYLL